jgi:hypothetical protein
MKRSLLLAIGILLAATAVFGQAGEIDVFSDPGYSDCKVNDYVPGQFPLYIVHTNSPGATESQFKLSLPGTFTWLNESSPFLVIGQSTSGVTVSYGSCMVSPILLITVNVQTYGATPSCTYIEIVPDPGALSGQVEAVDCSSYKIYPNAGWAVVNATSACSSCEVPSNDATWGSIKALYH